MTLCLEPSGRRRSTLTDWRRLSSARTVCRSAWVLPVAIPGPKVTPGARTAEHVGADGTPDTTNGPDGRGGARAVGVGSRRSRGIPRGSLLGRREVGRCGLPDVDGRVGRAVGRHARKPRRPVTLIVIAVAIMRILSAGQDLADEPGEWQAAGPVGPSMRVWGCRCLRRRIRTATTTIEAAQAIIEAIHGSSRPSSRGSGSLTDSVGIHSSIVSCAEGSGGPTGSTCVVLLPGVDYRTVADASRLDVTSRR